MKLKGRYLKIRCLKIKTNGKLSKNISQLTHSFYIYTVFQIDSTIGQVPLKDLMTQRWLKAISLASEIGGLDWNTRESFSCTQCLELAVLLSVYLESFGFLPVFGWHSNWTVWCFLSCRAATDHNVDNTTEILREWLKNVQQTYHYVEWRPMDEPEWVAENILWTHCLPFPHLISFPIT